MKATNIRLIISAAVVSMGAVTSAPAHATAIAYATNQLSSFRIVTEGAAIRPLGTGSRNTTNSANFTHNGFPSEGVTVQDPVAVGAVSDALQAVVGPNQFVGQNQFGRVTDSINPGMVGARADSFTSAQSALSAGGVQNVQNVAEARVGTNQGMASSSGGTNNANLEISYRLEVTEAGTIGFVFTNEFEYFASTTALGENAQATITNIFTIADELGVTLFTYSPTEINFNCASTNGNSNCASGPMTQDFSGFSTELTTGRYTISLLTSSSAFVVSQQTAVPEPGALAIFGVGLLSLGYIRRRNVR
ncbi:PEP-CTERM sorting domain-containing protein [Pseudoduganella sp. SL102]|uniref:PEP-CTERM sorting domain-containing protein n=1 Tax=Pseudoduganella sp. SL102 TaxID=2995154 RepID=UPI00248D06CC|nr:PEP-CTERM sorting domain-containing protein [Pseudoduganella sp. SL102]WBS00212.1 PEP-CTERM sorting domain-containing protein [Pseudoduganella sp. SL102]